MKSRTQLLVISLLFAIADAKKMIYEPMSTGRIAFAPEALVFDFDHEVPTRLMHNQPASRTEAIDKPKQLEEEEESSSNSSDNQFKLQEKEPEFFEAMDASSGLRYSITSSETNNNNNLWSCEALRQNEASVDMNDKKPLYDATNDYGYEADNEEEEEGDDEDDEEWGEDENDDFYDNEDQDGEIFPCAQSEELTELEISTNQNTLLNSLPVLPNLKTKTVRSKRGRRQPQQIKKRSSRQEHQDLRRKQRQQTRDLLLLKGGGGAGAIHARYSQNGRVTPSILNTVDSITLYKANLGKKPKQPERHRHSDRQRNPDASDNGDSSRRSGSSRNPNGSIQPAQPAQPSDPRNERTTQQRVIEEPPIEVVGHVPRKPLFFPSK